MSPTSKRIRTRVLVVDDEPSICRALQIALGRAGCDVVTATNGEAAHAILGGQPVDVLVLDLRMPDLRGDVIYHLASALQPALRTRTVFLTGDYTDRAQTIVAECRCPMIRKPFELDEVVGAVRGMAPAAAISQTA